MPGGLMGPALVGAGAIASLRLEPLMLVGRELRSGALVVRAVRRAD